MAVTGHWAIGIDALCARLLHRRPWWAAERANLDLPSVHADGRAWHRHAGSARRTSAGRQACRRSGSGPRSRSGGTQRPSGGRVEGHLPGERRTPRRVRGPLLEDPRRPRRGRGLTMECGLAAFRPVGATGIGVVGVFDVERRCEPRDDQAMPDAASVDRTSLPGRATGSSSGRGRSATTARVHRRTGRQIVRSVDAPARAARSPLDTIVTPPTLRYEHGHGDPDQRRRGGVPARHRAHAGPQTYSVARAPDRSDRPPAAHPPGGPRGVGT